MPIGEHPRLKKTTTDRLLMLENLRSRLLRYLYSEDPRSLKGYDSPLYVDVIVSTPLLSNTSQQLVREDRIKNQKFLELLLRDFSRTAKSRF